MAAARCSSPRAPRRPTGCRSSRRSCPRRRCRHPVETVPSRPATGSEWRNAGPLSVSGPSPPTALRPVAGRPVTAREARAVRGTVTAAGRVRERLDLAGTARPGAPLAALGRQPLQQHLGEEVVRRHVGLLDQPRDVGETTEASGLPSVTFGGRFACPTRPLTLTPRLRSARFSPSAATSSGAPA